MLLKKEQIIYITRRPKLKVPMKNFKSASVVLKLTAIAGATGTAPVAHAAIIESSADFPLMPPSTPNSNTVWDIDGSSGSGFSLLNVNTGSSGGQAGIGLGANASLVTNLDNNYIDNLKKGVLISSALAQLPNDQWYGFAGEVNPVTVNGSLKNTNFSVGTPGYFGFRFQTTNGTTDYGWGTLLVTTNPVGRGFQIENAYYDNNGNPIAEGDTGAVPEPNSGGMALLALGAAGLAAWRTRRKKAA